MNSNPNASPLRRGFSVEWGRAVEVLSSFFSMSDFVPRGYYRLIMTRDCELLRLYADEMSEAAFAELVSRHVNLVYSAAMRQVNGDSHLAQDVAQMVFSELSRQAKNLSRRKVLTGWLYTCAHFCATKAIRTERRRHTREQEIQAMHEQLHNPQAGTDWANVMPVIDKVMTELNEADREAILMRYFENKPLGVIGEKLGLSEDAARKRVERALEKLRGFLSQRGITTTASLAAAISANAVQVAPAGLAATLTTASIAGTAAGTGTTFTFLKLITMSKLQMGIISAVVVGGIATPLVMQYQSRAELREARAMLLNQNEQIAAQEAQAQRFSNQLAQANNSGRLRTGEAGELLRLRNEVGALRRQTNDLAKLQADNIRLRATAASTARAAATQTKANQDILDRESWAFVGYANPESAFQSAIWAMSKGDAKTILNSLHPDGQDYKDAQAKSESDLAEENKAEFEKVTGYKVVDKQVVSDSEVILTVYVQGENGTTKFRVQRIGNDWKVMGPVRPEPR